MCQIHIIQNSLLFHWFLTLLAWKVMFSIGSDNIVVQNIVITLVSQTLNVESVVFLFVLIACLHEMLSEHKGNNTLYIQHVVFRMF